MTRTEATLEKEAPPEPAMRYLTRGDVARLIGGVAQHGHPLGAAAQAALPDHAGWPPPVRSRSDRADRTKTRGLRSATIPAATERLPRDVVRDLKEAGADQMALSLDFPRAVAPPASCVRR